MAATFNVDVYSDALVVLGTAGVVVPLVRRSGLNPVLGYLAAGVILGPLGLGTFIPDVPLLRWLTVVDAKNVAGIADLGIVFLLFLIGLELSFERLKAMRRLVFGLGTLQVVVTTAAISSVAMAIGLKPALSLIVGACLALSSTAIVLEVLAGQGRMTTSAGRASFAILLAQDLAVVPLLLLVTIIGTDAQGSLWEYVLSALMQAAAAVVIIASVGRLILRPLFRLVASQRSSELFIAAILFVIIGTGIIAGQAGMSMALGAFIAGLLLAETEYRRAIEATIEPFKGLLLGIFFFTVGMGIDVREIARAPLLLPTLVIALIVGKALIIYVLTRFYGKSRAAALETAFLLAPGGEFAFVGLGLAGSLGLASRDLLGMVLAATSVSMALIPPLGIAARKIVAWSTAKTPPDPELEVQPTPQGRHAIVVGHGRVGKVVCSLLGTHGVPYVAVDSDANAVALDRRHGHHVFFGDSRDADFLRVCGLMDASGVVITIHNQAAIDLIVQHVRALRPDIPIVARARDAEHARHLYAVGATDAVPETIEASLQLSEAALVGLGIPAGPVIASIHEKRDEFRHDLQQAASTAGRDGTHAVRQKVGATR